MLTLKESLVEIILMTLKIHQMKKYTIVVAIILASITGLINDLDAQETYVQGLNIVYIENTIKFTKSERELIIGTIENSEKEIRRLLPALPNNIKINLEIMPRNIDGVGGTTGRAQKHNPDGEVFVYISNIYPGGVKAAVNASLAYTIHHEFHHLARGWTMVGNKFEQGIDIAMVNEGLAVVFGEVYTQEIFEGNSIPKDVAKWVDDVLALPKDANYNTWMNEHPDGRLGIGYRSGNFIIREAMKKSGKNILEMSKLQPEDILKLAGY